MKIPPSSIFCTLVGFLLLAPVGIAQQDREPGRSGPPGHEKSRHREFPRDIGPYLELTPLLFVPEIRSELGIDEIGISELDAFRGKQDATRSKLHDEFRGPQGNRDDIRKRETEIRKQANSEAEQLLTKLFAAEKFDRLLGLFVQFHGAAAVRNDLVAGKLQISGDELKSLRVKIELEQHELMDESRAKFEELFRMRYSPEEFSKVVKSSKESLDEQVPTLLTPQQREKLARLKGKEFNFSDDMFSRVFASKRRPKKEWPPRQNSFSSGENARRQTPGSTDQNPPENQLIGDKNPAEPTARPK